MWISLGFPRRRAGEPPHLGDEVDDALCPRGALLLLVGRQLGRRLDVRARFLERGDDLAHDHTLLLVPLPVGGGE